MVIQLDELPSLAGNGTEQTYPMLTCDNLHCSMLRAHSSQHIPTQIQVSREHSMSGLKAPQRDSATLPARMSSIRAREMDTQAKERETGEKVCSIAFQRRNSGGTHKIHSHNRKI